ncbi:MAG TPA: hypothetical protein PKK07_00470 [bacterium]|nr:hypothetical protein [bacterium]
MYAPVLKKLTDNRNTYIERALPSAGEIFIKEGDEVRPFDKIGECVYSQRRTIYPPSFKPDNLKTDRKFYYAGSVLGKLKSKNIQSPYNGNLSKIDNSRGGYSFDEAESKYVLLSGTWGKVQKVYEKRSVLISTITRDLLFAASTEVHVSGELVVFPNPMEILEKYYLESFSKNNFGKIVYVGHFADLEVVKRACEMGTVAVLAGSAHRSTFNYAKSKGLGFGVISGFGVLETPDPIYRFLSSISYRHVFFQGEGNILRIPMSPEDQKTIPSSKIDVNNDNKSRKSKKKKKEENILNESVTELNIIREVVPGLDVIVLQSPNFGKIGTVDRVEDSSIFVKFNNENDTAEVKLPNFFLIE